MPPSATRNADERPLIWIVAGPNGSGKSTAYSDARFVESQRPIWIINPDLLAKRIAESESLEYSTANLEAVKRIEVWLEASIRAHQTIGVETVLSTSKYRRLVSLARELGYRVRLTYVVLDDPQLNVERVRARVLTGGHNVAPDKIVERYGKSLEQLPWFVQNADEVQIFDNSSTSPRLVGNSVDGKLSISPSAPSVILKAFGLSL